MGERGGDCHRKCASLYMCIYIYVCVSVWVDKSVCVCHFAVGSLGFAFCLSCGICLCVCVNVCVCVCVTAVRATARGLIERLFRPWASSPWHCGHIEMPWRILGNYECLN